MDTLILKGCRFSCAIGVTKEERALRQPIVMDIELTVDTARATESDAIADTTDYLAVYEKVKALAEGEEVNLVETLGERVSRMIFASFPVSTLTLTIQKIRPMEGKGDWAGIRLERSR